MSSKQTAHNLEEKERSQDVQVHENVKFESMLLSENVLNGLLRSGFLKPSPIQLKAIPLGRCGFDLIVKAKSGTGKTAVFAVIALEFVEVQKNAVQALILAPTREIAVQIQDVFIAIGSAMPGLKVASFIGGMPIAEDLEKLSCCHIAIGAPGRVKHLIDKGHLKTNKIKLFVLDEADKLMDKSFQGDINAIYNCLPQKKQMIASSATYPDSLDMFISKYMLAPTHVTPNNDVPLLLGLKQFVSVVKSHLNIIQQNNLKNQELIRILSNVSFTQCLVFSNYQTQAESISNFLNKNEWSSIYISGSQTQKERLISINKLKDFKCRILLTTDLTARGIDAANVDLVINYHVPQDSSTYLHRMGRAGRYGAKGISITLAAEGKEFNLFCKNLGTIGGTELSVAKLSKDDSKLKDIWHVALEDSERVFGVVEEGNKDQKVSDAVRDVKFKIKKETSAQQKTDDVSDSLEALDVNQDSSGLGRDSLEILSNSMNANASSEAATSNFNIQDMLNSIAKTNSSGVPTKTSSDVSSILKCLEVNQNCDSLDQNSFNTLCSALKSPQSKTALSDVDNKNLLKNIAEGKSLKVDTSSSIPERECDSLDVNLDNFSNTLKCFEANQNCDSLSRNSFKALQDNLNANSSSVQHGNPAVNTLDTKDILKSISEPNSCSKVEENVSPTKRKRKTSKSSKNSIAQTSQQEDNIVEMADLKWEPCQVDPQEIPQVDPPFVKSPIPENIFELAYDYALGKTKTHWSEHCPKASAQPSTADEEIVELARSDVGFEIRRSFVRPATSPSPVPQQSTSSAVERTPKDVEVAPNIGEWVEVKKQELSERDSNKYGQYFDHYSNVLDYYGPWFEDVPSFDAWYNQWREEVRGVRDFVQQNVYLDEMNKFRSGQ